MAVIYKYELRDGLQTYNLPDGARILSVAVQRGVPCMWALVHPQNPDAPRNIMFTETGIPFDGGPYKFIGTMLTDDHRFVFHVLEEVSPATPEGSS